MKRQTAVDFDGFAKPRSPWRLATPAIIAGLALGALMLARADRGFSPGRGVPAVPLIGVPVPVAAPGRATSIDPAMIVVAPTGIDDAMVVAAPVGIDDRMVVDASTADR